MTDKPDPKKARPSRRNAVRKKNTALPGLIGVFVLAAGVAAFAAVLYLGYVRFYSAGDPAVQPAAQSAGTPAVEQGNTAGSQQDRGQLDLSKASLRQMQGNWQTKYGAITATLSLGSDMKFELILYMDAIGYERLITKGTYTYDTDNGIMRLEASSERPERIEGAHIAPLTHRSYNIIVLRKAGDNNILWVPHIKEGYRDQIHPVFVRLGVRNEYIEWRPRR